jgi:8-oxo-dGTP diphosphatase
VDFLLAYNANMQAFNGVNIALITENNEILTYLRDDRPDLFMANKWDLPGGGREAGESPFQTVHREVGEEFGIAVTPSQIQYERGYPSDRFPGTVSVFMVASLIDLQVENIKFGSEGQCYKIIPVDEWLVMKGAVIDLQNRLRDYQDEQKNQVPAA